VRDMAGKELLNLADQKYLGDMASIAIPASFWGMLAPGMYFISVHGDGTQMVKRIVKIGR
jgi:hypothetical protein